MEKRSIYVAFSNQKGGVGKSVFTTLAASRLHYTCGRNVAVIDCDYPQHSIVAMRERDKSMVNSSEIYKEMVFSNLNNCGKKAWTVLPSKPEEAISTADRLVQESAVPVDVVFFDLSGTVNSVGILRAILNLDYMFCPIVTDRLVMQSSLSFVSTIQEYLKKNRQSPLKGIYLFWNQVNKSENKELYDVYRRIIDTLHLQLLQTEIPYTIKYKREMTLSNRQVFRSTLLPADKMLIKGSNLDVFVDEISNIIQL